MKFLILRQATGFFGKLAAFFAASFLAFGVQAKELTFDQVFNDKGEPVALHYQGVYTNQSGEHRLEVWRKGQQQLKRRSDDSIETYVVHGSGEAEYQMWVLDLNKKINTRIDRTNLYRIGNFTDWFDLAHGLRHPKGEYHLVSAAAPAQAPKAVEPCKWFDLTQQGHTSHICWSDRTRLPLQIVAQDGRLVWNVSKLDRGALAAEIFVIHDQGFIRNDANQDIEPD